MCIDIAFGPQKTMLVPVGWHFDSKLPPECWAYMAMIVCSMQCINCEALLTTTNFKAYSIIDWYFSSERVVHNLSQGNYGNAFIMVLNAIASLEGEAKIEFEE